MKDVETPDSGLYPDVPFDDYLAWDAASNTRLGKLSKSAAHLREYLDELEGEDDSDSAAKTIGRAAHAAILEPGIFGEAYVTADECGFFFNNGKPCSYPGKHLLDMDDGKWACGRHVKDYEDRILDHVVVLSDDDAADVEGMREAVFAHPLARELLEAPGENELSGIWVDERTGIRCKLRADRVLDRGIALDLKTTRDASLLGFERELWKYGYHRQGALYTAGLQALGREVGHFVIIAVEKTPPYAVSVYRLTEGVLDAGEEEVMLLLDLWKKAFDSNEWPGYPERVRDLSLPPYAWLQIEDRLDLYRERKR